MKEFNLFLDLNKDNYNVLKSKLYDSNESYWLNEFLWRINEKYKNTWDERKDDEKKQLLIVLDYLEQILKKWKLEVRIIEWFNDKNELWSFLECIKTDWFRKKCITVLWEKEIEWLKDKQVIRSWKYIVAKEFISIHYDYSIDEIDTFKEDITNILFKFCKNDQERQNFEMFNIWFRIPGGIWDIVAIPNIWPQSLLVKSY